MKRFARFATLIVGLMMAMPMTATAANSVMVPYSQFKKWPEKKKIEYFKELRKAAAYVEKAIAKEHPFSASNRYQFEFPALIPDAWAEGGNFCLIGGVRRPLKANAAGKMVCKWDGRGVERGCKAGEFRCGSIYNDACVAADDKITDNCIAAAGNTIPSEAFYNQRRENMEKIAASCQNGDIDSRFAENCTKFIQRLQTIQRAYTQSEGTDAAGVPPIEDFGGTNAPIPDDPSDEKGEKGEPEKGETVVPPPEQPTRPPEEVVEPTPEPPPRDNCMERNRVKLGELACIACGMEEWNPADVLEQGGGVTKWVALIGSMAQTYHGPYNPGNSASKENYLGRVAEMISSYAYCTDNEYQMNLPNDTRNWLDGSSSLATTGPDQFTFASSFGLMSNKRAGLFSSNVENSRKPMTYAKQIFDVGRNWTDYNPQHHQWRFRSMIKAHYRSYPDTAFSKCALRAEARMKNLDSQKMCPMREERTAIGTLRIVHSTKMQPHEFGQNESFYSKLVRRCNVKVRNRFPNLNCDNGCKGSDAHSRASANMQYCVRCRTNCGKDDEPETERPSDGNSDGSSDGGKGGEPSDGRTSDGSTGDGTGKGGEGGDSTR